MLKQKKLEQKRLKRQAKRKHIKKCNKRRINPFTGKMESYHTCICSGKCQRQYDKAHMETK